MARALVTGSNRGRTRICPPSAVLPQTKSTGPDKIGNVIHDHLALRPVIGVDAACEAIPDLCTKWKLLPDEAGIARARCMAFEYMPPKGSLPEVALCLFDDGHVERIAGGRGAYDLPPGGLFALTIDLLWAEGRGRAGRLEFDEDPAAPPVCPPGSVLWVVDYKTGSAANVEPIEQNAQLEAAALLAARWTGAGMVAPAVLLVRKGKGGWDVPGSYLGPAQLDQIEDDLRAELAEVARQKQALDEGRPLEGFVTGDHCEYCPAASGCPAKTGALLALLGESLPTGPAPLDEDHLRRLLPMVGQLEQAANRIKKAARVHVETTGAPIDLGDGNLWGPHPTLKKILSVDKALPILVEEVGEDLARKALKATLARDAIKETYRELLGGDDADTAEVEKAVRGFYGRAIAAGAQVEASETWWSRYRPGPAKEPDDEDEAPTPKKKKAPPPKRVQPDLFHAADRYVQRVNPGASPDEARALVTEAAARAPAPGPGDEGRTTDPQTGLRLVVGPGPSGAPRAVTVLGGPLRVRLSELANRPALGSGPATPPDPAAPPPEASQGGARLTAGRPLFPR